MTRGGIEYNFDITPFVIEFDNNITLYFSSIKNVERFYKYQDQVELELKNSLKYRYKSEFDVKLMSYIINYVKIEKRGFRIRINEKYYDKIEDINFKLVVI